MTTLVRGDSRSPLLAPAAVLVVWVCSVTSSMADNGASVGGAPCPVCHKAGHGRQAHDDPGSGTLGYGRPGLHPGFQGFGLGYRPGYGYGGDALGVGSDGGYPFYGGPGYPHPWPSLRRIGGITPFPYYGGPGYPTPGCPNFFGGVATLVPDRPVVTVESDARDPGYTGGYGCFTGVLPYPETTFAPFVSIASTGGSSSGVQSSSPPDAPPNTAPARGEILDEHGAGRSLGIDAQPVVETGVGPSLRITRVYPESAAAKAGLQSGDVINSINGYATADLGNLAWIISNAAPAKTLKLSLRRASDGELRTITAQIH